MCLSNSKYFDTGDARLTYDYALDSAEVNTYVLPTYYSTAGSRYLPPLLPYSPPPVATSSLPCLRPPPSPCPSTLSRVRVISYSFKYNCFDISNFDYNRTSPTPLPLLLLSPLVLLLLLILSEFYARCCVDPYENTSGVWVPTIADCVGILIL